MATIIRLARTGRRNVSRFRIVVADSRMKRDGRFIEVLGNYNPQANPKVFAVNAERMAHWVAQGAKPSETVTNLLKQDRFFEKKEAIARGLAPETLNLTRLPERKRKPKTRKDTTAKAS